MIGHPFGGALSFSLSDTVIVDADERILRYSTPTVPGSSGNPGKLVACLLAHGSTF